MPQPEITQITPEIFRQALGYFQDSLIKNEQIINDLNVYPVPDSDTGTNALLTVKAGLAGMDGQKVGELAKSFAKSAAKLALGNSGVILSAYLTGLSRNLDEEVGLANWTQATIDAAKSATESLISPTQGTILTIADAVANQKSESLAEALVVNSTAARIALAKTTELLPELSEAGVVDAGAVVLTLFHDSFAKALRADSFQELIVNVPDCIMTENYFGPAHELMFNLELTDENKTNLIDQLETLGDSIAVTPISESTNSHLKLRIHLHCDDPDRVINLAKKYGPVSDLVLINLKLKQK